MSEQKFERPWGWYINVKEEPTVFKIKHICVLPNKRLSLQVTSKEVNTGLL